MGCTSSESVRDGHLLSCAFPQNWLHHDDQSWLELESFFSHINCWSSPDVGSGWSGESQRVLLAMALNTGVKLLLGWSSSDKVVGDLFFTSWPLAFLIIFSGSSM